MNRERFLDSTLALHRQGKSIRAIAADLGVNRGRVARALKAASNRPAQDMGPFVGRQPELRTLTAALDGVLAG